MPCSCKDKDFQWCCSIFNLEDEIQILRKCLYFHVSTSQNNFKLEETLLNFRMVCSLVTVDNRVEL